MKALFIFLPIGDYVKTRRRLWKQYIVPAMAGIFVLIGAFILNVKNSVDIEAAFSDFVGIQISAIATLVSFLLAIITILLSSDNENIRVDEFAPENIMRLITSIPWGHNQRIIFKCKDVREAIFYAQHVLENNWSRDVLEHQIESGLYERRGKAITNFKDKLPAAS